MGKINRNNLITRTITGAGFVVVILGAIFIHHLIFSALFFIVSIFAISEFLTIQTRTQKRFMYYAPAIAGTSLVYITTALAWYGFIPIRFLLLNLLVIPFFLILVLYIKEKDPILFLTKNIFGFFYVAISFSTFNLLFIPFDGTFYPDLAVGFFVIIWIYDSFAYLTGVSFGKRRLFKRISPKKSWEGTIGGFLFGLISAWILSRYFQFYSLEQWLILAVIIMVFGTFGDLAESLLKRNLNIKDSGKILPGHGGLLDRFDATLLAAPAVVVYVHLLI